MAIACFTADPEQSRALAGAAVPKGTPLFAPAEDGITCRFRTGYDVALWPLEVRAATLLDPVRLDFLDHRPEIAQVLRLELACLGRRRFTELAPPCLRFFLDGDRAVTGPLYELIFNLLLALFLIWLGRRRRIRRHPLGILRRRHLYYRIRR